MNHEHVEQRRQTQANEPFTDELRRAAARERSVCELAGDEEQQSHEERLQMPLPDDERDFRGKRRLVFALQIPIADVAIGHASVKIDDQHNHERAQVIDPRQSDGGRRWHPANGVEWHLAGDSFWVVSE